MADKILIVGHKNPDNDAVSAAIGLAYFENAVRMRNTSRFALVRCRLKLNGILRKMAFLYLN